MPSLATKLGRQYGRSVLKKPYQVNAVKKEVTAELTPYYQQDTATAQRTGFTNPRADLKRSFERNTSDYEISNNRMLQDIAAARQQRDWQQAGEIQSQNQQFGSRGLDMSSPTAQKLQARLQAIQQFNTDQQEQGFARQQKDAATNQARMNTDYGINTSRLSLAEKDFLNQRKKALQSLIAQETYNTAYGSPYQKY